MEVEVVKLVDFGTGNLNFLPKMGFEFTKRKVGHLIGMELEMLKLLATFCENKRKRAKSSLKNQKISDLLQNSLKRTLKLASIL